MFPLFIGATAAVGCPVRNRVQLSQQTCPQTPLSGV